MCISLIVFDNFCKCTIINTNKVLSILKLIPKLTVMQCDDENNNKKINKDKCSFL